MPLVFKLMFDDGRSRRVSLGEAATVGDLAREAVSASGWASVSLVAAGTGLSGKASMDATLAELGVASGTVVRVGRKRAAEMVRREVPADNSCLFAAVGYLCLGSREAAKELRSVVATTIRADPETWSPAVLGREDYATYISDPQHWGGSVELSILADYFQTQLVAIDVANVRAHYHPHESSWRRAFLLWDGIHYDAVALAGDAGDVTTFAADDESALEAAMEVAREAFRARRYTDIAGFAVRCLTCGTGLHGQQDCLDHARATGHTNFGESPQPSA